jgi:hypothetical protein
MLRLVVTVLTACAALAFALAWAFLIVMLLGCASSPALSVPRGTQRAQSAGVPLSIWRVQSMRDAGDGCEPWWFAPSVLCDHVGAPPGLQYNGCVWRCLPAFELQQ